MYAEDSDGSSHGHQGIHTRSQILESDNQIGLGIRPHSILAVRFFFHPIISKLDSSSRPHTYIKIKNGLTTLLQKNLSIMWPAHLK